ncbi:Uncharacterised protein [Vibrio cholerae]|nr:Uncharacterised protein [Vibrio cholerae]CSA44513.1 Uncharacterised protein [Vibrio cholerae]CSB05761.1 Uncharacterised protein [Vibrio cholerae]CSB31650.1 Uncharacterised protein [Vibrio cholerae]CSB59734.1 Uncharacterised protein [Vibrio cholerae]
MYFHVLIDQVIEELLIINRHVSYITAAASTTHESNFTVVELSFLNLALTNFLYKCGVVDCSAVILTGAEALEYRHQNDSNHKPQD